MVTPINDGQLYIPEKLQAIDELKDELVTFPNCSFYDCIDTLAMGVIILRKFINTSVFVVNRTLGSGSNMGLGQKIL